KRRCLQALPDQHSCDTKSGEIRAGRCIPDEVLNRGRLPNLFVRCAHIDPPLIAVTRRDPVSVDPAHRSGLGAKRPFLSVAGASGDRIAKKRPNRSRIEKAYRKEFAAEELNAILLRKMPA